ncbi:hypothetical protein [Streptomyces sp. Je 1-79]|uniref:Mu transposase domain-containing protein n=1 Tax=Streptomyces sp. Je 1-79 TaxID=2943847 RepID=UPI0035AC16E6
MAPCRRAVRDWPALHPRVDRYSQICLRTNRYSVPVRLIGRTVRVIHEAKGPRS